MVLKRTLARVVLGGLFLLVPGIAMAGPNLCTASISEAERIRKIPDGLLQAISVTESGVNGKPHPWALNLGGRVVYASTLDAAKKILGDRKAKGKKNLFAGCMQLSVKYHANAFASLGDLLQPQRNVGYAAKYLAAHFEDLGDWESAVRRYHGGKPRQSAAYFCKVWRALADLRPATAKILDNGHCGGIPDDDVDTAVDNVEDEAPQVALVPTVSEPPPFAPLPAVTTAELNAEALISHLDRRELDR